MARFERWRAPNGPMTLSPPLIGHLAMLLFSALAALSFTLGGLIAAEIDPGVLTALRFVIAAVTLACLARLMRRRLRAVIRRSWRWLVIGGLMATYFITMFEALRLTTPLATSAVFTLTPLFAAGFGFLLVRLRTGAGTLSALALGAIGALWVIFRADLARVLAFDIGPGEAVFFLGMLAHAAVPAVTRRLAADATSFEAAFGTVIGALCITAVYAAPEALQTPFATLRPAVFVVALYLGVMATAGTFFLLQVAIPRLSPGKVMAYTYLVPSWVVLHGALLGTHEPTLIYAGVAITLAALAMLLFQDVERKGGGVVHGLERRNAADP